MRRIVLEHPAVIAGAYHNIGAHVDVEDDYPLPMRTMIGPDGTMADVPLAHDVGDPPAILVQHPDVGMTDAEAGVVPGHTDYEVHLPGEPGYVGPASAVLGPMEAAPNPDDIDPVSGEPYVYDESDEHEDEVDESTGHKKKKKKNK